MSDYLRKPLDSAFDPLSWFATNLGLMSGAGIAVGIIFGVGGAPGWFLAVAFAAAIVHLFCRWLGVSSIAVDHCGIGGCRQSRHGWFVGGRPVAVQSRGSPGGVGVFWPVVYSAAGGNALGAVGCCLVAAVVYSAFGSLTPFPVDSFRTARVSGGAWLVSTRLWPTLMRRVRGCAAPFGRRARKSIYYVEVAMNVVPLRVRVCFFCSAW